MAGLIPQSFIDDLLNRTDIVDVGTALHALPAGHAFAVPENLFRKITDEERAEWQQKFAGTRD